MRSFVLLLLWLVALPGRAQDCYAVDAGAGRVGFEVKQAGAPFRGQFRRFGGELCLHGERIVRIDVWLEPASVETGLPEIDAALKEREFFDVAAFARLTFTSEAVEARAGTLIARGALEIKGRRREVQVPFKLQAAGGRLAVAGAIALNRLDFGVGTGEWADTRWLAADVKVEFSAPLVRRCAELDRRRPGAQAKKLRARAGAYANRQLRIMPPSSCSRLWQWYMKSPGSVGVTSTRTRSSGKIRNVSL